MPRLKGQLKTLPEPAQKLLEHDRSLLYGMPKICAYMGCSDTTLRSWVRKHAFPAAKMPNGAWVTSTELIDRWILSRNPLLAQHFV
jgi:hypothetical protein